MSDAKTVSSKEKEKTKYKMEKQDARNKFQSAGLPVGQSSGQGKYKYSDE